MRPISQSNAEAGFTLLELLVVIAILGAMAAALAGYGATLPRQHQDGVRELVTTLRLARAEAIRTGQPVPVAFDVAAARYGTGVPDHALPQGMRLSLRAIREARVGNHPAVRFYPDGSSTGAELTVTTGAQVSRFEVRWITGQVRHVE